jgi:nicotinamide mononucleotide transporter
VIDWFLANWTEIFGFVTGAACVLLAAVRNIWTFPLGLLNNLVFIVLFVDSALYADAGLQLVYIVLGVTGWIGWARGRAVDDRPAARHMPRRAIPVVVIATLAATAVLTVVLTVFTDSTTEVADAATTSVSLAAQFMLNLRWIENWFAWIAVDIAYIALFGVKGLWITAALYVLFVAICVLGYRTWRRAPREERNGDADPAPTARVSA